MLFGGDETCWMLLDDVRHSQTSLTQKVLLVGRLGDDEIVEKTLIEGDITGIKTEPTPQILTQHPTTPMGSGGGGLGAVWFCWMLLEVFG